MQLTACKSGMPGLVIAMLVCGTPAVAAIVNGDFEAAPPPPVPGWVELGGVVQLPPEGAGGGGAGANSAWFGGTMVNGIPLGGGFRGSIIMQTFDCEGGPTDTCYIKFTYRLTPPPPPAALAFVAVDGPAGMKWAALPFVGAATTRQIAYPSCGVLRLYFGMVEANAVTISIHFYLDNVDDRCNQSWGESDLPISDFPPQNPTSEQTAMIELVGDANAAVPAVSEWGLAVLLLLVLIVGTVTFGRRAPRAA